MRPYCSISWPHLGFTLETVLGVITAQKWPSELHVRAVFKPWRDTWPSDVFKICMVHMKKQVILEDFMQPVASLAVIPF